MRFGDRNSDVQPLPADTNGLHTLAGPLWPWHVTRQPTPLPSQTARPHPAPPPVHPCP
jgi:hypothetical protein